MTFFSSIRYLHIVPQLIREPDRSAGRTNDPYGGDFLRELLPQHKKRAMLDGRKILEALQIAVPQLIDLKLDQDNRGVWHLKAKYEHWRA